MTTTQTREEFPIKKYANSHLVVVGPGRRDTFTGIVSRELTFGVLPRDRLCFEIRTPSSEEEEVVDVLRQVHGKKIGELAGFWLSGSGAIEAIGYKYAKIKFGDVLDFYTDGDGVLKLPRWHCFRFLLDEFLEESPRVKKYYDHSRAPTDADFRIKSLESNPLVRVSVVRLYEASAVTVVGYFNVEGLDSGQLSFDIPSPKGKDHDIVDILRRVYAMKIGEIGTRWYQQGQGGGYALPMEYKYAKITLGDVFDFYTDSDGVLKFPPWDTFKLVLDQFLEEDPRVKYHPSRIRKFIDENGVEQLEEME